MKRRTIHISDLEAGHVIIGDHGGTSRVTGDVEESSTMPGLYRVETEHGPLYLDPEFTVEVVVADLPR